MKSKEIEATIYGNHLTKAQIRMAEFPYKICRKIFGDDTLEHNLIAIEKDEVFNQFGILYIVDENSPDGKEAVANGKYHKIDEENSVIIGTIRMGFGHWRIAIALASEARHLGYTPYILDLMAFGSSPATKAVKFLDRWYSRFSRLSQFSSWFNKNIWEKLTSTGNINLAACLQQKCLSKLFIPLVKNLPENIPILSTHPWIGHSAVMAEKKRVISIIPDNLPMAFWLVENSIHTTQSPSSYMGYRVLLSMGTKKSKIENCIPKENIIEAGHYVDFELTSNIDIDCERRLERSKNKEPRRFLLTMGGAGAQVKRFSDIAQELENDIKNEKAALLINMGDHKGRWELLKQEFDKNKTPYVFHNDWEEIKEFAKNAHLGRITGIHVFLNEKTFFGAVYTTNILIRVCDIMITKPSELSFYPVPKLFIQRVGRHEAWGAIRGSEIGDGTIETSSDTSLHRTLHTLIDDTDLIELYCTHIVANNKIGVYNGALNAVKLAVLK